MEESKNAANDCKLFKISIRVKMYGEPKVTTLSEGFTIVTLHFLFKSAHMTSRTIRSSLYLQFVSIFPYYIDTGLKKDIL